MAHVTAAALSGGSDSLMTLALLLDDQKKNGGDIFGLHAFFLPPDERARENAARLDKLCKDLGVGFHAVDLSEAFEKRVIQPFIAEYAAGRTPNPCALCNPRLKFGLLMDAAMDLGATRFSTGHYVRIEDHPVYGTALKRGVDPVKDQSYFLALVPQERLEQVTLPLGTWNKTDVVAGLKERGLQPPQPSESQEICFIPDDDYKAFLTDRKAPLSGPGPVTLPSGEKIARHKGLWRYTIGQRRGLGISWKEPLYVVAKDVERNTLIVGPKTELGTDRCTATDINLLVPCDQWPDTLLAKTRYRQKAVPATVTCNGDTLEFRFEQNQVPAPGQVAAVYDADGYVLAAGIIA